jgi:alanine dehydrogenase
MSQWTISVFGSSRKENERRRPIHPGHLDRIAPALRRPVLFERGYGEPFGVADADLAAGSAGLAGRDDLFARGDVLILAKPELADFQQMRPGSVLWGWAHCVQDPARTQIAIDRRLTLITWESMNTWTADGRWASHVFARNNEIAGYAAVLHATGLAGFDGHYGPPRRVFVTHFGSVSRGAVRALRGLGFADVTVLTREPPEAAADPSPAVTYRQMTADADGRVRVVDPGGGAHPLIDDLAEADVIVNGILQDTDRPLMFVRAGEQGRLKAGCLIVDVSCDAGVGFPFARPTTFGRPMLQFGPVSYYAVDHTPSYLWRSATWEISTALLAFLPAVLAGPDGWEADETIRRAIEIRDGRVLNPKILSFQKRAAEYPHAAANGG